MQPLKSLFGSQSSRHCSLLRLLESWPAHTYLNSRSSTQGKFLCNFGGLLPCTSHLYGTLRSKPSYVSRPKLWCFLCAEIAVLCLGSVSLCWDECEAGLMCFPFLKGNKPAFVAVQCLQLLFYTICLAFIFVYSSKVNLVWGTQSEIEPKVKRFIF